MYVLQLNTDERDYLLTLLKSQRAPTAKLLVSQLKTADDVFGAVTWTDDDIKSKLREHKLPRTPENIQRVRHSYYGRHIDDHMIECGWTVLEDGILELKATVPEED